MLPGELLHTLTEQIAYRDIQIEQLIALLFTISPSSLIVHGAEVTGKSLTLEAILQSIPTPFAIVRSRECITTRHLLERTLVTVRQALEAGGADNVDVGDGRCESISVFVVQLQQLMKDRGKFILVLDGIDRQREAAPTLLPAIARLGELVHLPP